MPWVRLDDKILGDLKVLRLSDGAFRLWVLGLAYCQQHLTDGLIPREALHLLKAKRADVDMLCAPLVDGKAALWERIEGFGFKVHDYLDWNESRDVVLAKRANGRTRIKKHRSNADGNAGSNVGSNSVRNTLHPTSVTPLVTANTHSGVVLSSSSSLSSDQNDPFTDSEITERAARFIERYEVLYPKHRTGARYLVKPHRDYVAAVELCKTWPDERLDKLAAIFLTTDHQFAASGSRTIPQFAALASWADGQLAEWEAKRAQGVA